MGEIGGKILNILATVAVFTLVVAAVVYPAISDKGTDVVEEINAANIGTVGN